MMDILPRVTGLLSFPNPVNEKAARVVAGVVLVAAITVLAGTGWYWLLIPISYGFWARVLSGPTLSPLGWAAQNLVAPRLGAASPSPARPSASRTAIGALVSTAALVLALGFGAHVAADALLVVLGLAAGLESILGYCVGCRLFGWLMRPESCPRASAPSVRT